MHTFLLSVPIKGGDEDQNGKHSQGFPLARKNFNGAWIDCTLFQCREEPSRTETLKEKRSDQSLYLLCAVLFIDHKQSIHNISFSMSLMAATSLASLPKVQCYHSKYGGLPSKLYRTTEILFINMLNIGISIMHSNES